jgi:hypothetical protein
MLCAAFGQAFAMAKKLLKTANHPGSCMENVSEDLQAGNFAESSKPQISMPDREFESLPLRHFLI